MIYRAYLLFLRENCPVIQKDPVKELILAQGVLGYLCRAHSPEEMFAAGRLVGVRQDLISFRKRMDMNHYSVSRFWRAVWHWTKCHSITESARRFSVKMQDLEFVLSKLSPLQIEQLHETVQNTKYIEFPNQADINKVVLGTRKCCQRLAYEMRFVPNIDQMVDTQDIVHELMGAAMVAVSKYDHEISATDHLINIARVAAENYQKNLIEYFTAAKRRRQERICEATVELVDSEVRHFQVGQCRVCTRKSATNVCGLCQIAFKGNEEALGSAQDQISSFMSEQSPEVQVKKVKQTNYWTEEFSKGVISLETPAGEDATVADFVAAPMDTCSEESQFFLDLRSSLPAEMHGVVALILGFPNKDFNEWSVQKLKRPSAKLDEKTLVKAACDYFEVDHTIFKSQIGDFLGYTGKKSESQDQMISY